MAARSPKVEPAGAAPFTFEGENAAPRLPLLKEARNFEGISRARDRLSSSADLEPRPRANGRLSISSRQASDASSRRSSIQPRSSSTCRARRSAGRLFLTSGASGEELCLRPEYTIPVCRAYLSSRRPAGSRNIPISVRSFALQAEGGERIADRTRKLRPEGCGSRRCGNLCAVDGGGGGRRSARRPTRRRASVRQPARSARSARHLAPASAARRGAGQAAFRPFSTGVVQSALAQPGVLAALESADHAGAKALVEDLLAIAGIDAVGGRSAGEIADRFLEQAALRSGRADRRGEARSARSLSRGLGRSRRGGGEAAPPRGRGEARSRPALDAFERATASSRPGASRSRRRASAPLSCATSTITPGSCSRRAIPPEPDAKPALGGGRYDGLARRLGAGEDIPAVGAAITLDRLPFAGAR